MAIERLKRNRLTTCQNHERVVPVCVRASEAIDVHVVLSWLDTRSSSKLTLPRDAEACQSISELSASIVCYVFALAAHVIIARSWIVKPLIRRVPWIHAAWLDRRRLLGWNRIDVRHLEVRQSSVVLSNVRQYDDDGGLQSEVRGKITMKRGRARSEAHGQSLEVETTSSLRS